MYVTVPGVSVPQIHSISLNLACSVTSSSLTQEGSLPSMVGPEDRRRAVPYCVWKLPQAGREMQTLPWRRSESRVPWAGFDSLSSAQYVRFHTQICPPGKREKHTICRYTTGKQWGSVSRYLKLRVLCLWVPNTSLTVQVRGGQMQWLGSVCMCECLPHSKWCLRG